MKSVFSSIILICILPWCFVSCGSKSDDPQPQSEGYVRFKVNGVQKEFKVQNTPMGFSLDAGGPVYTATALVLGPESGGTKNFLNLTLRNETLFQTGINYQMQSPINYKGVAMVRIMLTYANETGQIFNAVLFQQNIPGTKTTDDAQWKFTRIADNWVEGEFQGVLLGPFSQTTGRGNTELMLTDGQFSMSLVKNLP